MLVHADNFSLYGGNKLFMLNGVYAQIGNTSGFDPGSGISLTADPNGTSPGSVLTLNPDYGALQHYVLTRYVYPTDVTKAGAAFRLWLNQLPSNEDAKICITQFRDAENNPLLSFTVDQIGRIKVRAGNFDGAVLYTTANVVYTANGWYHTEIAMVRNTTSGSIEIRIEGQPVLSVQNINTGSGFIRQHVFANDPTNTSQGFVWSIKDYVLWDGTGTVNNDFLGSVLVTNVIPNSDLSFNWSTTGGSGFSILDNAPPVDAQFISAGTPPPPASTFGLTNLPSNITSVRGLVSYIRASKNDGGDAFLTTSLLSGEAQVDGANRPLTVSPTYWRDVFEIDPATGNLWTPGAVDNASLKLNRTA